MACHTNTGVVFAPFYIHKFCVLPLRIYAQLKENNIADSEPLSIENVGDRLRFYRIRKSLRQIDVAQYVGVSRCVYADFEKGVSIYPLDKLSKIAELYQVPVEEFVDDYNHFLQTGQGCQIRALRSELGMTQREFAFYCGIDKSVICKWEMGKVVILKSTWERLFKDINLPVEKSTLAGL